MITLIERGSKPDFLRREAVLDVCFFASAAMVQPVDAADKNFYYIWSGEPRLHLHRDGTWRQECGHDARWNNESDARAFAGTVE
jgi:hypothetical protein